MTVRGRCLIRAVVFGTVFYLALEIGIAHQRAHQRAAEAYYIMMHDSLEALSR